MAPTETNVERSRGRSLLHGQDMGTQNDNRNSIEQWLAVGGWWWLAADGGWRLAVGNWWRLAVGGWRLAVGGPWGLSLGGVLKVSPAPTVLSTAAYLGQGGEKRQALEVGSLPVQW